MYDIIPLRSYEFSSGSQRMKFQPIHQEDSLHSMVVRQIERSIRENELKPGDRLPTETQLAKQFGVSRTVIREAVMMLRQANLLDVRHGVGTFVAEPLPEYASEQLTQVFHRQKKSIWEVHEVRSVLEPELAAIAAQRIEDEELVDLQNIFTEMVANAGNAEAFIELDLSFHNAIAAATQNMMFSLILSPMMKILLENRKLGAQVPGAIAQTLIAHEEILNAIRARDSGRARAAMLTHLGTVTEDMRKAENLVVESNTEPNRNTGN